MVASKFSRVEHEVTNREFRTVTGTYKGKRLSVVSTGIGIDNIDIVVNELDALVNIDFDSRTSREKNHSLNLIRIGTSGSLQPDIPVDSLVVSSYGLGLDGLVYFYERHRKVINGELTAAFFTQASWPGTLPRPYIVEASPSLLQRFGQGMQHGITATAPGFYAPQGRALREGPAHPDINQKLSSFRFKDLRILNYEMETSALYGLGQMLGHKTLTMCLIVANRPKMDFSRNYLPGMEDLITHTLDTLAAG
jgi:uridine phosphorylase